MALPANEQFISEIKGRFANFLEEILAKKQALNVKSRDGIAQIRLRTGAQFTSYVFEELVPYRTTLDSFIEKLKHEFEIGHVRFDQAETEKCKRYLNCFIAMVTPPKIADPTHLKV